VLIGGGVGVTPLMSILRTHADRDDRRPVWLFLANESEDSITFREEIDGVCETLPVTAVHTLSHPPPGWEGEQGHLDAAMLRRHLPPNLAELRYFICGPPGLLDAAGAAIAELGVPAWRVHSERFAMV
jgi:ferredoxin-NADP reductase